MKDRSALRNGYSRCLAAEDNEPYAVIEGAEEEQSSPWRGKGVRNSGILLIAGAVIGCAIGVHMYAGSEITTSVSSLEDVTAEFDAAKPWVMCPAPDKCGQQQMLNWNIAPVTLANRVSANLESLPGTVGDTYAQVAQRWQASPPAFKGVPITLGVIANFIKELLMSDPFGTGGNTVPYVDFHNGHQHGGQVVAISQRQVAFLTANALMGNTLSMGDGLTEALKRCTSKGHPDIIYSQLSMLAILSQELAGGRQGAMLIAATPGEAKPDWLTKLSEPNRMMVAPTICQTMNGASAPTCNMPDFMAGGALGQAMTDIAGTVVGGGSQLCTLANSQDESLVQFYGEALAFSFFVASGPTIKMVPAPWVLLGARSYMKQLTGESTAVGNGDTCGHILEENWLNEGILEATVQVPLNNNMVTVPASSFVAVASKSSAAAAAGKCPLNQLMNNNCDVQRRHLMDDVRLWYRAFEASHYNPAVQQAFSGVITRIGTGPWGAGVWYGDSQQYFLATWLATSLLSSGNMLDYYIYDHFCENPGNQCFLLGATGCGACVASSETHAIDAGRCGAVGVNDMVQMYTGKPALALFNSLRAVGAPPAQVFDLLKPLQGQLLNQYMQPPPQPPTTPPPQQHVEPPPVVPGGAPQGAQGAGVGGQVPGYPPAGTSPQQQVPMEGQPTAGDQSQSQMGAGGQPAYQSAAPYSDTKRRVFIFLSLVGLFSGLVCLSVGLYQVRMQNHYQQMNSPHGGMPGPGMATMSGGSMPPQSWSRGTHSPGNQSPHSPHSQHSSFSPIHGGQPMPGRW